MSTTGNIGQSHNELHQYLRHTVENISGYFRFHVGANIACIVALQWAQERVPNAWQIAIIVSAALVLNLLGAAYCLAAYRAILTICRKLDSRESSEGWTGVPESLYRLAPRLMATSLVLFGIVWVVVGTLKIERGPRNNPVAAEVLNRN